MAKLAVLSFLYLLPSVIAFNHPGLLVTDADISRAKDKIAAGEDPWLSSWEKLTSIRFSSSSYASNAVATVSRSQNGDALWHDAAAAFNLALRWKISGEDTYADTSAKILTTWATKLQALSGGGNDDYLTAGLQGYQLANAAELLRDYRHFSNDGLDAVKSMMTGVFLPMNIAFLEHELPSEHNVKHFFANWELCNVASAMAISVLTENQTLWDWTIGYFKHGSGNGAINNAVTNTVAEPDTGLPLGQGQESGRDQGHSALDLQLFGVIGQQAWNQGEDLFGYNDSRILLGAEYFARYNLGHDVPFEPYTNGIVSFNQISSASRGAIRPTWELLYAHYVQIKGLNAPWTAEYLNKSLEYFGGFEGGAGSWGEGSGHYDGVGWGSLLYHLDESDASLLMASESSRKASSTAPYHTPSATLSTVASIAQPTFTTAATQRTSSESANSTAMHRATSSGNVATMTATSTMDELSEETSLPMSHRHHGHGYHHSSGAVKACLVV